MSPLRSSYYTSLNDARSKLGIDLLRIGWNILPDGKVLYLRHVTKDSAAHVELFEYNFDPRDEIREANEAKVNRIC